MYGNIELLVYLLTKDSLIVNFVYKYLINFSLPRLSIIKEIKGYLIVLDNNNE